MFNECGWFRSLGKTARRYFIVCCHSYLALSFLGLQMAGCAAPLKLPPYQAQAVETYRSQKTNGDVHVAVKPITDAEEQQKYFGVVLTDAGVLPVHIVVENRSPTQRFLVRDDLIILRTRSTNRTLAKPMQQNMADASRSENAGDASRAAGGAAIVAGNASLVAGSTAAAAGAFVFALPAVLISVGMAKNSESAAIIQNNLFDNTLYTRTVLPNKTIMGFAFFKVADGKIDLAGNKNALDDFQLLLQATNEGTQAKYDFEFHL